MLGQLPELRAKRAGYALRRLRVCVRMLLTRLRMSPPPFEDQEPDERARCTDTALRIRRGVVAGVLYLPVRLRIGHTSLYRDGSRTQGSGLLWQVDTEHLGEGVPIDVLVAKPGRACGLDERLFVLA